MAKLQACPKCGAQFDVSGFARGQQFRCGACGHLIVAHAEAAPAAATAAPSGRAPGSRVPGAAAAAPPVAARTGIGATASQSSVAAARSPKGPQYQPVQRAAEPAAQAPSAPARERERDSRDARESRGSRSRGGREAPARKGPPVALLVGGGVLVVGVLVAVLTLSGGGDDGKGSGTSGRGGGGGGTSASNPVSAKPAEVPSESLTTVQAAWRKLDKDGAKDSEWKAIIQRFKRIAKPEAEEALKEVYEQYIETTYGTNDPEARKALGFTRFDYALPEAITQKKGYDFVAAVEEAYKKRWLEDDEVELATKARKQCEEHARKLETDSVYRAGDNIWANILQEPLLKDYNFVTRWVAPHMICYSSKDRLSELDLLKITSKKERQEVLKEMREKRARLDPMLDEKAMIYEQLYKEWNNRFQKALGLKDLAAPYGGRDDLPPGTRSFQDGAPLVVWIFDTHDAFKDYNKRKGWNIDDGVRGYFQWSDQWIYLFDEGGKGEERIFEIGKNLHEGAHQLESWFTRQLNKWALPKFTQTWFGEGLAEYLGAHKMTPDGKIEFIGVNASRLKGAQGMAAMRKRAGKEYPLVELQEMMKWTSYNDAIQHAGKQGLEPGWGQELYIYQQGWMLMYMCLEGMPEKYRDKMHAYIKSVLMREEGSEPFRRCFKIRDEDDWELLQKDFEAFAKKMLALDLKPYTYEPPKRAEPKSGGK